MVPSLTETLIECGVEVVGRTRFCIHPQQKVRKIPVVGGTKDYQNDLIETFNADFIVLDREENPQVMSKININKIICHVVDLKTLSRDLKKLGQVLKNEKLLKLAELALKIDHAPNLNFCGDIIPGVIETLPSSQRGPHQEITYIIWKDPWMCVAKETFIGSVLLKLGLKVKDWASSMEAGNKNYPCLDLRNDEESFLLFSSEPYPFLKKKESLLRAGFRGALVDGEKFSWFGIRSLSFLAKEFGFDL